MEYSLNDRAIIFFSAFELTYKKLDDIFALSNPVSNLLTNYEDYLERIKSIVNDSLIFDKIYVALSENKFIDSYIKNLNNKDIVCITYLSKDYPESLKNIEKPPFTLFCKGDISLLNTECIAIVGTRKPTAYGKIVTEKFAEGLVVNNFTIASGMAAGVDSIAHKTALLNNGKTIAVLGSGFENIYPTFNLELSKQIEKYGLLVSEYCPSVKPALFTFPFRNRIIAGLSKGVLITEAGEKSGALHTKEYALEQGKEVFAVPGNINSENSKGTNRLIRSLQGACVLGYEDIVQKFKTNVVTKNDVIKNQISFDEDVILKSLKTGEKTLEELQELTRLPINKLNSALTIYEIKGVIKKLPGNKVILM